MPLAPLHLPAALAGIDAVSTLFPGLPQVACFDTAFHRGMPAVAHRLPLPRALAARGIQRYGFHGLSYEYVVATARRRDRSAARSSPTSATARAWRRCVTGVPSTRRWGSRPPAGSMMGTRSGDLDPGVLVHLLAHEGFDASSIERPRPPRVAVSSACSGTTSDMKALLEARATDPRAAEAVELFCHVLRKHIGAFAAVLGGIDTLVFTGGIGEHAAPVREETCRGLEHLGIRIDRERNDRHEAIVSAPRSACTVRTLRTDEDLDDRPPHPRGRGDAARQRRRDEP